MILAQQAPDALRNALNTTAEFLPKFLGFLVILIVGYIVAKVIAKVVNKVLDRVGFDRAVERGGVKKAMAKSQYDASDLLAKIVFYALFLFVLQMAFGVFGPNPISELIQSVIAYLPKVFVAIVIIVVASAIAAAVREIIDASLGGLSYSKMLGNIAAVTILAIGVFAALAQLQIAEPIVIGLFYAILAVVAGSAIIAIGGGGIQPMRNRWESALQTYDQEKEQVKQEAKNTDKQDLKARAQERKQQAEGSGSSGNAASSGGATLRLPEEQGSRRPQ